LIDQNERHVLLVGRDPLFDADVRRLDSTLNTTVAPTAGEAMAIFRSRGGRWQLVLCDRDVPEVSCIELFMFIQAEYPGVQCAITVMDGDVDRLVRIKNRCMSLLVFRLPVPTFDFLELVDEAIRRYRDETFAARTLCAPMLDGMLRTREKRAQHLHVSFVGSCLVRSHNFDLYLSLARYLQPEEYKANPVHFDCYLHEQDEARRMLSVAGHLVKWFERFSAGDSPLSVGIVGDGGRVDLSVDPGSVVNGPTNVYPSSKACALLAWMLFCAKPQSLDLDLANGSCVLREATTSSGK